MQATQNTAESVDESALGPPARFDAEPVRRKSRRWMLVVLALFVVVAGAVGIAVGQGRAYFKSLAAERDAKQKREQDENATSRRKKVFEIGAADPDLPERFGKPKEEAVTPIPVIRNPDGGGSSIAAPSLSVPPPTKPSRPSMFITATSPPSTSGGMPSQESILPPSGSLSPASAPAPSAGSLEALLRPQAAGGSQARPRSVQEQARRASSTNATETAQALAVHLGNRSHLLPRGAVIPCTLLTQLDSTVRGPTSCLVSQDVYSDDGRMLLVERGASISGEYGAAAMRNGDRRLAIVWRRIRTPHGVVIDIDSPAADSVGTVGVDGHVDNHWIERIGAALMLSLIDDAIQVQVARQGAQVAGGNGATQPYQATTGTTKSIAERVLESTVNIPPTITKNRGERLLVILNRDLWFDQVYETKAR